MYIGGKTNGNWNSGGFSTPSSPLTNDMTFKLTFEILATGMEIRIKKTEWIYLYKFQDHGVDMSNAKGIFAGDKASLSYANLYTLKPCL